MRMKKLFFFISPILISASIGTFLHANANGIGPIIACINPSGLIHVVQDREECGNNEKAVELQVAAEPTDCPCFTAEDLDRIAATGCNVSVRSPNYLILIDLSNPSPAVAYARVMPDECTFYDSTVSPIDEKYAIGLYDEQSRACLQLLKERASELELVCN